MLFRIAAYSYPSVSKVSFVATSFQKLRDHYPKSALVTDLISIYDAQYVVRASILLEGSAIATGLAADRTLEAAEDRARSRVLEVLGLSIDSQPHDLQTRNLQTRNLQSSDLQTVASSAKTSASGDAGMAKNETIDEPPMHTLPSPVDEEEPALEEPEEDLGPPIDAVVEQSPLSAQKPSAAAIALENFNTSALPVDLSDVIAQTDVELRRLGWTSTQGQEYLEKTYGKRSRRQLTDDELMSFLLYLEDQQIAQGR